MRRSHISKAVLLVLFLFLTMVPAPAVAPNPKLVSLVPPTAQMVAGMIAPQRAGEPSSFLLTTHHNLVDLDDFMGLSGVDGSRNMEQVIMVASDGGAALSEHSLLVSGQFDQGLIYRSVQDAGAEVIQYRSIAVLEVQPLAREHDSFHDVRWLAMLGSSLAVFGTSGIVQQELDRYLDHSPADPGLGRRLAHLRHDDATWCLATLPSRDSEIQARFNLLDSRLAGLLRAGDTIEFGTHYGRQIELEYEVELASSPDPDAVSRTLLRASSAAQTNAAFVPAAELTRSEGGVRGVLKIPRARYEAWIERVLAANAEVRTRAETH